MAVSRPSPTTGTGAEVHLRVVPGTGRDEDLSGTHLLGPRGDLGIISRGVRWPATLAAAQARVRAAGHVDSILDELVGAAASLVDASASAALVDQGALIRKAAVAGGRAVHVGALVPIEGTICGTAVTERRVVRTGSDLPQRAGTLPGHGEAALSSACCPGARSHLAVPLTDGDAVLGVLSLTAEQRGWFDDGDQASVALLAGVAARALAGVAPRGSGRLAVTHSDPDAGHRLDSAAPFTRPGVLPPASLHGLGLWSWDAATGATTHSASVGEIVGLGPADQLTIDTIRAALHPDDLPRFESALTRQLAGAPSVACTFRVNALDGERQVHAWGEVRRGPGGVLAGAWGAVVDVTDRERQAAALRSTLAGLRAAQELTGLGVWEWHPREGRLEWSPEMFRIAGLEPGQTRPSLELWHRLVHPDDRARAMRLDALADEGGGTVETFRLFGMDGEQRHVQAWSTVIPADGASARVVAGAVVDVSRQVEDRVELERRSSTDPVTKLANRLGFERRMKNLLEDDRRDVGLLLLDLDRFKMVNDSLGHQVGDRLLVEVARRLERVAPAGSLTARMGGDEFVVVPPPGVGWRELRAIAQDVVEVLRVPFSLNENGTGEVLFCPASVGVTCSSGRRVGIDDLLSEADLALYRAKDDGRDRYVVFDDALRERARGRHRAEQLLRAALDENRLVLQYQPIVDFTHGRVVGAEALVRMRAEDDETLLPPEMFVDVAEDVGLVVELDCWVLETALSQLARWLQHAPSSQVPWLAVNVSPRSMEHPRVVRTLLDGLASRRLPPHLLKVELTENSFLSSLPGGEKALQTLIANQVPVGIDDFGTGYSALAYLTRFELDFMKIDRSFVASVGQEARADAVVTAIVALAHAHRMKVTAEGVETPRQARRLREIGCDFAQGYHFGRPGDASRILRG
ncbi:MAG: EAL domain-containing protein [Kineosporiaceae bacterium]|nr:EAL domain-containing protein [Kineosporiaceae bacterium]